MRSLFIASTVLFALSSGAMAADLVGEPSPEVLPASFVWTGGYLGVVAGVNFLVADTQIANYDPAGYHPDSTSGAVGGKIGYNYQFSNNFVLGAEASLLAVFNDGSDDTSYSGETINVSADWQGQIVAKAGYAVDRFLPYVKGGVAFIHLDDVGYEYGGSGSIPLSRGYTGWTIGAGVDYAVTNNWLVGLDYSYAKFDAHDFDNDEIGPTIIEPSTHTISASVSYKF